MVSLRSVSSLLLLAVAIFAPWIGGAPTTLSSVRWWISGALALAFLLTIVVPFFFGTRPVISRRAGVSALFLLTCLGWWSTQPEPSFATNFGADFWAYLTSNDPLALFQWPRPERLVFWGCLILGFLATIELGRDERFRRQMLLALGFSGLGFAIYAVGFARLGWPPFPWTLIKDGPERFNVSFAHYSAPPACLNLAWPLLVFGSTALRSFKGRVLILGIVSLALPLWDSAAGQTIAVGLLATGTFWRVCSPQTWLTPVREFAAVIAILFAVTFLQGLVVVHMQVTTPDHWVSAEETQIHSPERDAALRALSERRGDRLVISDAPDRPAAWLAAARMAADSPFIGLGPGAWAARSALYTHDSFVSTFYLYRQYAHHDLLQFAAEWGGMPALAMLALWAGGFWNALNRNRHRPLDRPPLNSGLVLALLGIALHSTVDFPLQNPALQLWTALLLGLAWSKPSITVPGDACSVSTTQTPETTL